jgi:hypothetical protein
MAFVLCTPFNEKMSSSDICTSWNVVVQLSNNGQILIR